MNIQAFQVSGRVEEVLVATSFDTHVSRPVEKIKFAQGDGVIHDNHSGHRLLDVRDAVALKFGFVKGMEVFNTRQWSAISTEEIDEIKKVTNLQDIPAGYLGENMIVSGIPDFTMLPPGTQFFFKSPEEVLRTVILMVMNENGPCHIIADVIKEKFDLGKDFVSAFVKSARRRRGLVGIVIGSGFVKKGDTIVACIPEQRLYGSES